MMPRKTMSSLTRVGAAQAAAGEDDDAYSVTGAQYLIPGIGAAEAAAGEMDVNSVELVLRRCPQVLKPWIDH